MDSTLKCCKKKFGNQFCIVCHNVYHPSCKDGKKTWKDIGDNRILCSKDCQKRKADDETSEHQTILLKEEIIKSKKDNMEKNEFIKRQKRISKNFGDDIFDAENRNEDKIKSQH
ncbi:hypothetical protein JTB14_022700 [Gonioctena quinquepunctata]|nr:hypothetical protein JTB14_022700 [Gonioctena quinquepunctata]